MVPMIKSSVKSGVIFAMMISVVVAGDIKSCSIVPADFSLTIIVDESSEPLRISSIPKMPVTMNHDPTNPGL